jgi:hypothetical protein
MDSVYVTNKNDFTHADRCDGIDYVFPPGERVLTPSAAATHMLGYNLLDKTDTLVRLGWAMKYDPKVKNYVEDTEGVQRLARFVFEEAVMTPKSALAAGVKESALV